MLNIGEPAPHFSLSDHAGVEHTLRDYLGQFVVLWFYPKAATPG